MGRGVDVASIPSVVVVGTVVGIGAWTCSVAMVASWSYVMGPKRGGMKKTPHLAMQGQSNHQRRRMEVFDYWATGACGAAIGAP